MGDNCLEPVGCWQGAHKGKPPAFTHSPPKGRKFKSPLTPSVRTEGTFFPTGEPATKPHVGPRCPWGNSWCPLQGVPLPLSASGPWHMSVITGPGRWPPEPCPERAGSRGAQDAGLWALWGAGWADSPHPAPLRQPKHPRLDVGPARLWAARLDASRVWMLCDSREWEGRLDLDRTEESLPGGRKGFRSPVPRAVDALVTFGFHRAAPEASSEDAFTGPRLSWRKQSFPAASGIHRALSCARVGEEEQIAGRSGGPRFSGHTPRPLSSCPAPSLGLKLLTERSRVESPRPCAPPRERTPHEPGSPWPEEPNLGTSRDSGSSAVRARVLAAGRADSVPAPPAPGGRPCVLLSRIPWPPTRRPGSSSRRSLCGRGQRREGWASRSGDRILYPCGRLPGAPGAPLCPASFFHAEAARRAAPWAAASREGGRDGGAPRDRQEEKGSK